MSATEDSRKRKRRRNGFVFVFPAALFYYEILFRLFTGGELFQWNTLVVFCFCCAYGGFGYLLSTVSRSKRRDRHIAVALLVLTALPFIIEIFIFQAFKLFYDLNTVVNGANDVLTGFMGDILRLVFSGRGILCILLYLLPGGVFGVFGGLLEGLGQASGQARAMELARMAAFFAICLLAIHLSPGLDRVYDEAYNFNGAVSDLGLLTGVRLDIKNDLFGGATFTATEQLAAPVQTAGTDVAAAAEGEAPAEGGPVVEGEAPAEGETVEGESAAPRFAAEPVIYDEANQLDLPLNDGATGTKGNLNSYVSGLTASKKNSYTGIFKGKNLILITAEAFSKEVIDPELTPALYRLATKGVQFTDFYQPTGTGTTGGEYQNIFGLLPTNGGSSFPDMAGHSIKLNIGTQLNNLGYYGKAFHNNTYTYYDRDKTHTTLGYSDGYMAYGNGMEAYVTKTWPESDYEMFTGTVPTYIDRQPFDVYYMTVSGHGLYEVPGNTMSQKNQERVQDLPYSDIVKNYLAANLELEDSIAYLLEQLEEKGIADDTVICLAPDHFPYGLDDNASLGNMPYMSELYGYDVETTFQRDHSCWLLWCGALEDVGPIVVDSPTFSLDILPTLLNLFGIDFDSRLFPGRDVFSDAPALVFNGGFDWKSDYGTYYSVEDEFIPAVDESEIPANYVENTTAVVRNKVSFCRGVLDSDYYTYLFWR